MIKHFIVSKINSNYALNNSACCDNTSSNSFIYDKVNMSIISNYNTYLSCIDNKLYFSHEKEKSAKINLINIFNNVQCFSSQSLQHVDLKNNCVDNFHMKKSIPHDILIKINNKFLAFDNNKVILVDTIDEYAESSVWIYIEDKININHDIVISRYTENIDWSRFLQANVIIYNKGFDNISHLLQKKNLSIIKLENIGREGHTYLHHIINNYETLKNRTTFLQADPFCHSPNIMELLCESDNFEPIQSLSQYYTDKFPSKTIQKRFEKYFQGIKISLYELTPEFNYLDVNTPFLLIGANKNIHVPIHKFMKNINLIPKNDKQTYKFIISALFSIELNNIKKNSLEFYKKVSNILIEKDKQGGMNGYILELLWHTIFE